jgi:DNA helicase IV
MAADRTDLKLEQDYFDVAWNARERKRETLGQAHLATAGPGKTVTAVKQAAQRDLETLGGPDDAVAVGRFDTIEGDSYYIGRHVIRSDDGEVLVMNWQVPAAAPYFRATIADPGGIALKRQFETERNRVKDFEDTVFAEIAARLAELSEPRRLGVDDTVLRDMEQSRDGEMRDIVQTIHAAQYELIQRPFEQLLIIQGGPGTGKTAVALHRVSWLLYNDRDRLKANDVLVIGPNPTFTRYIRKVLPDLGDVDVAHQNLRSLGPEPSHGREEDLDVTRLKGEARMAGLLERGMRQRVRFPEREVVLGIGSERTGAQLGRDVVEAAARDAARGSTYNGGRGRFRTWLTSQVQENAREEVTASQIDGALERVWPSLTAQTFLRDLFGSRERLVAAAGDDFTAGDVGRLLRPAQGRLSDERWADADVCLLDEADALINGEPKTYLHIVVDEAQDLSPMQLRAVRRRSRNGSMTVVGDLAQSTGASARDSWDDVQAGLLQEFPASVEELKLGYRVPAQIFEFAARLLPLAAPAVTPPTVIRVGPSDPQLVESEHESLADAAVAAAREYAGRGLFVGIVCPDSVREEVEDVLRVADVQWSDTSSGSLGKSINVSRPVDAKGLEFDAVVVVDPESVVSESERGHRMLYIALTRTTRYLTVVHTGIPLPLPEMPALRSSDLASSAADEAPASEVGHVPVQAIAAANLGDVIVQTAAKTLADQLRTSVPPDIWINVLDRLRKELGISDEEIFSLLE